MTAYCTDRDLLSIEPILFIGAGIGSGQLAAGSAGSFQGVAFADQEADFQAAAVQAGMVLTCYHTTPSEGGAYEIVSVDGPDSLAVSVLRPTPDSPLVAPPVPANTRWFVRSYRPQIVSVSRRIGERLREMCELEGISDASFADSNQLRVAAATGVLAEVFLARAQGSIESDSNWIKARHYREEHQRLLGRLQLAADLDGDGLAERTRSLANVTLRRQ